MFHRQGIKECQGQLTQTGMARRVVEFFCFVDLTLQLAAHDRLPCAESTQDRIGNNANALLVNRCLNWGKAERGRCAFAFSWRKIAELPECKVDKLEKLHEIVSNVPPGQRSTIAAQVTDNVSPWIARWLPVDIFWFCCLPPAFPPPKCILYQPPGSFRHSHGTVYSGCYIQSFHAS
jgi:hypothetical protein